MVVQHNISAMTANRYYGINNSTLGKSMEKLSSGYAINRAGDNAAGLAVSEKMRAQIAGLNQASKNAQDGISMVQTYEGALQETDSILQRMRTIAVQSANGSYQNDVDRDALQLEFDQLNDELNQIADTDFNGVVVLNGGVMADGTVANDTTKIAERPNITDIKTSPNAAFTYNSNVNGTVDASGSGSLTINGVSMKLNGGAGSVSLGNDSLGKTTYSTRNITVNDGKVSGDISLNETYKIDDKTTKIELHGSSYTVKGNKLLDDNGDDVNYVDGLEVNVNEGENVTLGGSYTVIDNVVYSPATFSTQSTSSATSSKTAVNGKLDNDLNGKVYVQGRAVELEEGKNNTGTEYEIASNGDIAGKLTVKTDATGLVKTSTTTDGVTTNYVAGTIEEEGEFTSYEVDVDATYGASAQTAAWTSADRSSDLTFNVDGIENPITVTCTAASGTGAGSYKIGTTAITSGTAFYLKSDGTVAADASEGVYKVTLTLGADIDAAAEKTTFSFDEENCSITKNSVDVVGTDGAVTTIDLTADKSKFASALAGTSLNTGKTVMTGSAGGTNQAYTLTNANGKVTMENTFSFTRTEVGEAVERGTFKVSTGVSTSDTYNHGTANLTFADNMTLQVGARSKDAVKFNFSYTTNGIGNLKSDLNASARGLGTDQISVRNQEDANAAIDAIDNAINKVSMIRGTFGAIQNRLEHKISNIDTNAENITAAESRIRDTQMDQEMMKFTSAQILSQASQSMLAQANSLPQGVLQLLG